MNRQTSRAARSFLQSRPDRELRERLKKLMVAAGEPEPEIRPAKLYP